MDYVVYDVVRELSSNRRLLLFLCCVRILFCFLLCADGFLYCLLLFLFGHDRTCARLYNYLIICRAFHQILQLILSCDIIIISRDNSLSLHCSQQLLYGYKSAAMHIEVHNSLSLHLRNCKRNGYCHLFCAVWLQRHLEVHCISRAYLRAVRDCGHEGCSAALSRRRYINGDIHYVGFLFFIAADESHCLSKLAKGSLSGIRGSVEHIRSFDCTAFYRVCPYSEMNLNSAFSPCIHRTGKSGVGDRRGKQRNEVLIVCHGCSIFYIPVQCFVLHIQANRHNRGEYADFTGDSRCAVLNYAAYYVFSIGELHSVTDTVYHSEDSGIRHEIVYISAVQEGVSKSQYPVIVYSGDCSCCGHREVSVNDSGTYSFSRLKLCSVKCRRVAG